MKDLNELERFETEHLILRKARPDDTEYMLKNVWSDESLPKYMLWKPTFTIEEAEERMKKTMKSSTGQKVKILLMQNMNHFSHILLHLKILQPVKKFQDRNV